MHAIGEHGAFDWRDSKRRRATEQRGRHARNNGDRARRGRFCRAARGGDFSVGALAGHHRLAIIAFGQPLPRGGQHARRRGGSIGGKLGLVEIGITCIHSAFGQRDRLAAIAAHGFKATNCAGDVAGDDARNFVGSGAGFQEVRQDRIDTGFDRGGINTLGEGGGDFGQRHLFKGLRRARDGHRQLFIAHQIIIQPR